MCIRVLIGMNKRVKRTRTRKRENHNELLKLFSYVAVVQEYYEAGFAVVRFPDIHLTDECGQDIK